MSILRLFLPKIRMSGKVGCKHVRFYYTLPFTHQLILILPHCGGLLLESNDAGFASLKVEKTERSPALVAAIANKG